MQKPLDIECFRYEIKDGGYRILGFAESFTEDVDELVFPEGVTEIAERAFRYYAPVEIYFPKSLLYIEKEAFEHCLCLKKIEFADDCALKKIGIRAFYCCEELTIANLPNGLCEIERDAFCCCFELSKVFIPTTVKTVGRDAFQYCDELEVIYIDGKRIPNGFDPSWKEDHTRVKFVDLSIN